MTDEHSRAEPAEQVHFSPGSEKVQTVKGSQHGQEEEGETEEEEEETKGAGQEGGAAAGAGQGRRSYYPTGHG